MTNEEKKQKMVQLFENQDAFEVLDVRDINFNPHPFTIGPRHVAYATEHNGSLLTQDILEKVPCKAVINGKTCNKPHHEHTHDVACFLALKRNVSKAEAAYILENIIKQIGPDSEQKNKFIDGFAFVKRENFDFYD